MSTLPHPARRPTLQGTRPVIRRETSLDGKEVDVVGDFVWKTYAEVQAQIDAVGSGVVHFGLAKPNDLGVSGGESRWRRRWCAQCPSHVRRTTSSRERAHPRPTPRPPPSGCAQHKLVGIYSKNRMEWVVTEQACNAYGWCNVPLYDTLGAEAVSYICGQTGMHTVFAARTEVAKVVKFKAQCAAEMGELKNVVQFEDVTRVEREAASAVGLTLRSFAELAEAGRAHPAPHTPPSPSDLAFICYTSGTTGAPKGAMITHANIVADAAAAVFAELGISKNDVYLSYLPLAHVMERLITTALWSFGARVGFFQGDTLKLMEDIKQLRPTLFASVPRLYNRCVPAVGVGAGD